MCGIFAFISKEPKPISFGLDGIKKLESRGYDSVGFGVMAENKILINKLSGTVSNLESNTDLTISSNLQILHNRWATHGCASNINAHPHTSNSGKFSIVHNGVIDNYKELKDYLSSVGFAFVSETDSEVIANLIQYFFEETNSLEKSIFLTSSKLKGSFAIAIISKDFPDLLIGIKKNSPLIIGIGKSEHYLSSELYALPSDVERVVYMEDDDIVYLSPSKISLFHNMDAKEPIINVVDIKQSSSDIGLFETYMEKEIFEQPSIIRNILNKEFILDKINLEKIERIFIIGCGSSYHAGLTVSYFLEKECRIPTFVYVASDFEYKNPEIKDDDVIIFISQSGETADTLSCLKNINKGYKIALVNTENSSIARLSDHVIYLGIGVEVSVAATKSFVAQLVYLFIMSFEFARINKLQVTDEIKEQLLRIPGEIESIINKRDYIRNISLKIKESNGFMFLGKGVNYPIALEGALKLKEIAYVFAEGYFGSELKHGPIALVDENLPVISLINSDGKMISNVQVAKSRKGKIIGLSHSDSELFDNFINIPQNYFDCITNVVSLQLLAYYIAKEKGLNVDKPRNLAKSVTV